MSESGIIEEINNRITIEFDNNQQAKIIHDSISLEIETAPDYRSSIMMDIEDNVLSINIIAQDATSFRASFNSVIKWIILSFEIYNLTV